MIPAARRQILHQLAAYVTECGGAGKPCRLCFICTHNSRRSHFAQLWAAAACPHFGIPGVETFSGGTSATAFDARAVAALRRAGFRLEQVSSGENPAFHAHFAADATPLCCYSKIYSEPPNPQSDFCAVMTCAQADSGCPVVTGARRRLAIPYDDPQVADGTPHEATAYDTCCAQVAREILYAFSTIARTT
ncbi:MAG: protein-tyrosine-phosphatase [Phycisphaerae bacterium]|nr:protein-tyrosine-phosphatase [Phycisphaerae bacterium]